MPSEPPHDLPRVLNAAHATSMVVGIIIGSGIFLVPHEMMAAVGSAGMVYAVWVVGGLLSLFGAMTYAEIAAGRPRYGGEYAFLREAYGDQVAFLYMWTWVLIAKPASQATIAAGFVRVLATFPVFAFFTAPAFGPILWAQLVAVAITWAVTLLNILGTRGSGNVQLALTWLKVALIIAITACCFLLAGPHGSWQHFASTFPGARGGFAGFMTALVAALWAYDGWSDVTQMAGEVQRPQRSLPIALVFGVAAVGLLYMLTNAAIQFVLPATVLAESARPAADAIRLVTGGWGAGVVSLGMAVSIGATFVGSSLSGARVPFAAARDGLFFQSLAHVSPRFPDTLVRAGSPSRPRHPAPLRHRPLPGALLARHLRRVALLRPHRQHHLCLSPSRPRRRTTLQHGRLPRPARPLYPRRLCASPLLHRRPPMELARRRRRHPARHPRPPRAPPPHPHHPRIITLHHSTGKPT